VTNAIGAMAGDLVVQLGSNALGLQGGVDLDRTAKAGGEQLKLAGVDGGGHSGGASGKIRVDLQSHDTLETELTQGGHNIRSHTADKIGRTRLHQSRTRGKDPIADAANTALDKVLDGVQDAAKKLQKHIGEDMARGTRQMRKNHEDNDKSITDAIKSIGKKEHAQAGSPGTSSPGSGKQGPPPMSAGAGGSGSGGAGNNPPPSPPSPDDANNDGRPRPAAGPGEKQLEQLDDSRVTRSDGLITHVDGQPVDTYAEKWAQDRSADYRQAKEDGTFSRKSTGACVGAGIDRRTGSIVEGINGRSEDVIPIGDLHPTLAARYEAIKDAPPHPDNPLGHAEVKAANMLLWQRRQHGLPDDESALSEMVMSVQFPFLKDGSGMPGRIAPFCANCNHMLDGVPSTAGRFTGYPPGEHNFLLR
jgi:hypothetical protein